MPHKYLQTIQYEMTTMGCICAQHKRSDTCSWYPIDRPQNDSYVQCDVDMEDTIGEQCKADA